MSTRAVRMLNLSAGFAWLVVAGYGVRTIAVGDEGDWKLPYLIFSLALLAAAALSVSIATVATRQSDRPRLRTAGLAISAFGGVTALVAWAFPLWMTVLGVGFAVVAFASGPRQRRALAFLAAGQLVGVAVMLAGIALEIGSPDEYGDYPAAGGIALGVVAALAIVGLFELRRSITPTTA